MPDIPLLTSEIQSLESWNNFWVKTGLWLGGLAGAFGVGSAIAGLWLGVLAGAFGVISAFAAYASYWYSSRLKPVQGELARIKEEQLIREQQTLAEGHRRTAEAQEKAAEKILAAMWHLSQVRSLQTPRRLVKGQNREKFLEGLKASGSPVGTIEITWGADLFIGEPERFAKDIAEALTEGGWTVRKTQGALVVQSPEEARDLETIKKVTGLKILVRDPEDPPTFAKALNWALHRSGFLVDYSAAANLEGNVIELLVWPIPPDGAWVLTFREN
jgi:hypothetical protein